MDMRTVAIWGNSLVLSSIRASLERRAGLRVLPFDAATPGATEQLRAAHPESIIFDLGSKPDSAVSLWKAQPDVQLIGVDVSADQALVLSGRSSHVLTIDDLVQIIEEREPVETRECGKPGISRNDCSSQE
jgi:hypothetical protein